MSGPGISQKNFFDSLTKQQLLQLLPNELRSVVDALVLGPDGIDLSNVIRSIINFKESLVNPKQRPQILSLLTGDKQAELCDRLNLAQPKQSAQSDDIFVNLDSWQTQQLLNFFGIDSPSTEEIQGWVSKRLVPTYPLFAHQLKAVEKLMLLVEGPISNRGVLHFPTGVGKTRTAMHFICQLLYREKCVVIWLASGKELLEQASDAFTEAWTTLGNREIGLHRMHGDMNPELETFEDGLIVVGLQKAAAQRLRNPDFWKKLSKNVRLVVFDEAHQTIAPTYKEIVEDLCHPGSITAVLGLTATPGRTWSDIDKDAELADFYDQNLITLEIEGAEGDPIGYLINNGYLSQPDFQTLHTNSGMEITMADHQEIATSLEIPARIIADLTMREQYLTQIIKQVHKLIDDGHTRIIVFAASVLTARLISALLEARAISSACITGETDAHDRTLAIKRFRNQTPAPLVLVNFGVLTTGFDAPNADAAVIARPTKSLVLFSQMVGRVIRGPRTKGGTENCTIVTVVDTSLPSFGNVAESFTNWNDVWR